MNLEQEAIGKIVKIGHQITEEVSRILKSYGVSEPQFHVLQILSSSEKNPLSVQEIGRLMIQKSSNVTRLIDKLVKNEWVERNECPTNRRKMDILITRKGQEHFEKLIKKVDPYRVQKLDQLKEKELKQLIEILDKINRK